MIQHRQLACIGLLLSLILIIPVHAADDTTPRLELQARLNQVDTLQADFKQRTHSAQLNTVDESSGHFSAQKPGKFRWEILAPDPLLMIADGTSLWVYDELLEQVTVQPMAEQLGQMPALLLTGQVDGLLDDFVIQDEGQTPGGDHRFTLLPMDDADLFESIILDFDQDDVIRAMVITDSLEQITELEFNNTVLNQAVNPDLFTFIPPADVDVIGDVPAF